MSSQSPSGQVSQRIRAFAFVIAVVLVAGAFVAVTQREPRPVRAAHFLGLGQLRLDAAKGNARLYLRIQPITPAKPGPAHSTDVSITSVTWGVTGVVTTGSSSGGGGAGKPKLSPFSITKTVDRASPLFFRDAVIGAHVATSATIYVLPPVGSVHTAEALIYILGDPTVSSATESSTLRGSGETIGLVYSSLTEEYLQNGKVKAKNVYAVG
jgi:type VI protein secretion system component Hcp